MLESVKIALRIAHSSLDDEIKDIISSARHDLMLSGISSSKANADIDIDPLVKRAIIIYTKANFTSNKDDAERYQNSYNMLKNHLSLAGDYTA